MKVVNWIVLGTVMAGVVAGAVFVSLPKPVEVDAVVVVRGPLRVTVDAPGVTRVHDRHVVTAPLYGNLARIELEAGDDVDERTVLARITPLLPALIDTRNRAELELRVKASEAALRQTDAAVARASDAAAFAKRELLRIRPLVEQGTLPQQTLDLAENDARDRAKALESARFGARVARYEVELAKAALARDPKQAGAEVFEIHAPVAGRVLRRLRQSEGVVQAGEPLLELGDPEALEVVIDVLTTDAVAIRPGAEVTLDRWGGPDVLHGTVERVEPAARTEISALGVEEQRVDVIVELMDPPEQWRTLGDAFHVEAAITTWYADDVVVVPVGALHRRGEAWAAYAVEGDEAPFTVVERELELGHRSGTAVEVTAGLEPGETVVVHPSDAVKDGVSATVRP